MGKWNSKIVSIGVALIALLLFVPFLGGSHLFDWDEINFAEAAREMLVTGEYSYVQIDFKPFWEKPPLFIWMQALSMSMFGVNEFAARFPNAICGALTLVLLFNIGQKLIDQKFGLLWVLVYAGSMLSQFYFRSGIIDPWYNLFIFLGVHQLILASSNKIIPISKVFLSAIFIGLAMLTKGPTALALVGLMVCIYFVFNFSKHTWKIRDALVFLTVVFVTGFSWYLIEILRGHGYVVQEFIDYHIRLLSESEAGHGQPFYYHPLVLLIGCFPMSLFFIFNYTNSTNPVEEAPKHYRKWMTIMFWVVLIVFSIVKTKIVHYSSLTYVPMSFIASYTILQLIEGKWKFKTAHQFMLLFFSAVIGTAFAFSGILNVFKQPLLGLLENDAFTHTVFSQFVPDGRFDLAIGVFFLLGSMVSIILITTEKVAAGVIGLFATTLITVTLISAVIAPKIDRYTQKELFDFYKEKGETSYLKPVGYHTYAHLFYGKHQPIKAKPIDEMGWMILGAVDKPVYFISRIQDVDKTLGYFPHLKQTDQKGGYVILERMDAAYPFLGAR